MKELHSIYVWLEQRLEGKYVLIFVFGFLIVVWRTRMFNAGEALAMNYRILVQILAVRQEVPI